MAFTLRIDTGNQTTGNASPQSARTWPHNMFGVVPVTWPEIWRWVETLAKIPHDSSRARLYADYCRAQGI